jgi:putative inorganic carbon (hco3(-)) transporter
MRNGRGRTAIRAVDKVLLGDDDSLEDVYRLRLKSIWRRLKDEPLHFWLFCGYLFFEYFRPQGIFPIIDFLPWARMLVIGALLAVLIDRRESKSMSGPLTPPFLAYFSVLLLSIVFAYDPAYSMRSALTAMINWLIVYLLFLWIVNTKFRFLIAFGILFLASLKLAQHGFRVSASRGFGYGFGVKGPQGYFENAADLGVQMAIYTPWAVAVYFGLRKYWPNRYLRWLFIFAPVAGVVTALATGQRNTLVAFAAMGIAVVLFSRHRVRSLLIMSVVAVAVYALASDGLKARFETAGTDETSDYRLMYWERGIDFYAANPVLGVGFDNWIPYYMLHYPGDTLRGRYEVAHSVPITVAVETGTLGLVTYYFFVLCIFLANARSARLFASTDPPFWRYFALSLNVGLVGFLTAGIFLSIAYYPFLYFQAGLTAALYRLASREREKARVGNQARGRLAAGSEGGRRPVVPAVRRGVPPSIR